MTHQHSNSSSSSSSLLPHHRLRAYGVALELLAAVRDAKIRDRELRDEADCAFKSVCLNTAEATRAVKRRAFAIARGEAIEAVACVEIAALAGDARAEAVARVVELGNAVYAMLTALVR